MSASLGLPVELHFAVLTKHKKSLVQILLVKNDASRVAVLRQAVAVLWAAIRGGNFYPSPSPQNCTTCPYRSRCPMFAGR